MKLVTALEAARDIRSFAAKRALSAGDLNGSAPRDKDMPFRKDWGRAHTLTGPIKIWMSAHALAMLQSLILISAANGAPVLFARRLGARFAHPIDGEIVWRDSHSLLGRSKTWRGLAAAVLLAACAASPHESALAAGRARCHLRNGGRLPLVLRQTAKPRVGRIFLVTSPERTPTGSRRALSASGNLKPTKAEAGLAGSSIAGRVLPP